MIQKPTDTPVRKLVKKANLSRPEIVVIICYSGPLFILYNGVLRGFGTCGAVPEDDNFGSDRFWEMINRESVKDLMERAGHLFPSTIHLLVSAVKDAALEKTRPEFFSRSQRDIFQRNWYKARVSVVLPPMTPEQKSDVDAKNRFIACIANVSNVAGEMVRLGKAETVAAGTKVPVDGWLYKRNLQEGLSGLRAEDKLKLALEAAGFKEAAVDQSQYKGPKLASSSALLESIIEESEARVRVYKEKPAAWFTRSNGRLVIISEFSFFCFANTL